MKGVYKITNLINKKVYVGSTLDIENRFQYHKSNLKNGTHDSSRLQHMFDYECNRDFNNLSFDVLEEVDGELEEIRKREDYWIKKLRAAEEEYGYNFATANVIGTHFYGKDNPFYGKTHSDESKRKIGDANRGHKHSEETKKLWSLQRKGENNPCYGKKCYTNGIENRFFIEGTEPEGWVIGQTKRRKKRQR